MLKRPNPYRKSRAAGTLDDLMFDMDKRRHTSFRFQNYQNFITDRPGKFVSQVPPAGGARGQSSKLSLLGDPIVCQCASPRGSRITSGFQWLEACHRCYRARNSGSLLCQPPVPSCGPQARVPPLFGCFRPSTLNTPFWTRHVCSFFAPNTCAPRRWSPAIPRVEHLLAYYM